MVAKYLHAGPGISIKVNPPSFEEACATSSRISPHPSIGEREFSPRINLEGFARDEISKASIEFSTYLDCVNV